MKINEMNESVEMNEIVIESQKTTLAMANKILRTMENQRFYDFYNGKFETYLMESGKTVTKEQILEEIVRLFDLK